MFCRSMFRHRPNENGSIASSESVPRHLKTVIFYFRHHVYRKTEGGKDIELSEVGPRFEMKSKSSFCFCDMLASILRRRNLFDNCLMDHNEISQVL